MSGYNRSCSKADSSILLAAQCAAALSMMPASAPSCWMQGVTAASYKEYAIGFSSDELLALTPHPCTRESSSHILNCRSMIASLREDHERTGRRRCQSVAFWKA